MKFYEIDGKYYIRETLYKPQEYEEDSEDKKICKSLCEDFGSVKINNKLIIICKECESVHRISEL